MQQLSRPQNVKTAVELLYIGLCIGLIQYLMSMSLLLQIAPLGFVIFIFLLILTVMSSIIYMIGKGRNWARIIFLVLFIMGLPFSILPSLRTSMASFVVSGLGIIQAITQIAAIVFLFQRQSSAWFKQKE